MKSFVLQLGFAGFGLLMLGRAEAADISAIKLDKGAWALVVTGDIEQGDGAKFRSEASKYNDGYVLLESDGGSLIDAIDIGETIRLKGYATAVINGSSCNSACALIWLAGTPRALSRSGRIGFHAAYSDRSGSAQESGVANAMVGRYLTLLNLPEKALIFATSAPPSSLSWLTASNYKPTGIDVTVIDDLDFSKDRASAKAKTPEPPPLVRMEAPPSRDGQLETSIWRKLDPWTVYIDHTLDNGCFLFAAFEKNTLFRVGVNRSSGGYYVIFGNPAWQSIKEGQEYDVHFQFDDHSPWDVPTTGITMAGTVFLKVSFKDSTFWDEFVSSKALDITRNDKVVTTLLLSGVKPAFDELVSCQKYEDGHKPSQDPFAQ